MVDLTDCDREPIHVPGTIQPYGVLLVLTEPEEVLPTVAVVPVEVLEPVT